MKVNAWAARVALAADFAFRAEDGQIEPAKESGQVGTMHNGQYD